MGYIEVSSDCDLVSLIFCDLIKSHVNSSYLSTQSSLDPVSAC